MTNSMKLRLEQLLAVPSRSLLGIAGPPGSGKSTIASDIAKFLGLRCAVVPMDGFHLSNLQLARLGRSDRKGAPDTFDAAGYIALLKRLREPRVGETVYAPEFHRDIEESIAAAIAVPPATPLVVTEGNYLLLDDPAWRPIRDLLDDIWYVDLDDHERKRRLVARHRQFGRSEAAAQAWVERTDEPNSRTVAASRAAALFYVRNDERENRS